MGDGLTLAQLIYNIRLQLKDNKVDDLKLSDSNIEFMIAYLRAKLIRQDLQKYKSIAPNVKQSLGSLELELVDIAQDPEIETGINILKTVKRLPNLIEVNGKNMLTFVGGLDSGNRIDLLPKSQAIKRSWQKYASKRLCAYLEEGYLYVVNCNKELRYITASGIFEDPREVSKFTKKSGEPCYDIYKDNYPMSRHMIDMVNSLIKRQELDLYFQILEDKINDGQTNN